MTKLKHMSAVVGELGGESEMGTLVSEMEELRELVDQLEARMTGAESKITFFRNKPSPGVTKKDVSYMEDLTFKLCTAIIERMKAIHNLVSDSCSKFKTLETAITEIGSTDATSVGTTAASIISGFSSKAAPLEGLLKPVKAFGSGESGRRSDRTVSI